MRSAASTPSLLSLVERRALRHSCRDRGLGTRTAVRSEQREHRETGAGMAQARVGQQPEPDEDMPPLPAERRVPDLPSDAIPELDEDEPPTLPADDIPQPPDQAQPED